MLALRRAIALSLVFLVVPSVTWLTADVLSGDNMPPGWIKELIFVACCLVAAATSWAAVRYWRFILLAVAGLYTYIISGPLIVGPLFSSPGAYIGSVIGEAERRGFADGTWMVWSLLVLPAVFPAICALAIWLCFAVRRSQGAGAI